MKDALEEIFETQTAFNRRFFADRGLDLAELSGADRAQWTKQFVLHVEGELHELLRETNWKMHRLEGKRVNRGNVLEEWTDCFKFLLGLANVWGFSASEVLEEFRRKSRVVDYRYGMEQRLRAISPGSPVVAVDIDGVLNDYPGCFLRWVSPPAEEPFETLAALREKVGPKRYREIKDEYRKSGAKREQGVRPGAREMLNGLRAAGYSVVLLSKRPYWRFYRIYADTLEWLERNGLRCDAVLFHREKHRKILEDFPNLIAMVEDDPAVAREILSIGVEVFLVEGELNVGAEVPGANRISNVADVVTELEEIGYESR